LLVQIPSPFIPVSVFDSVDATLNIFYKSESFCEHQNKKLQPNPNRYFWSLRDR
jgi:hypothetical protein